MGDGKTLHDVQQRLHYRYITAVIAVCLPLVGCGPRNDAYNPSHFAVHAVVAPPDVAVPSDWGDQSFDLNGLYVEPPQALSCCWIAPQTTLYVRKHGPASKLVAGFWVPNSAAFSEGQRVHIVIGDTKPAWHDLAANGPTAVTITLPPALRDATGLIPIHISTEKALVPKQNPPPPSIVDRLLEFLGLRAPQHVSDNRRLGVILRYLYFNSKTGPRAEAAVTPSPATQAPFFPVGVLPPENWQQQRQDGVWSADTRASCCFLAKRADVRLANPAGTQLVAFDVYVPSNGPLASKPVTLTCAFDGIAAGPPVRLQLGTQTVTFAVPPVLRNTPHLTATLESSVVWVPAQLGLGNDKRELSVMLQRVGYI